MEILTDYLIFLLKVFTIALAITVPLLMVIGSSKGKSQAKGKLSITNLSDKFEEMGNAVKGSVMNPKELKQFNKEITTGISPPPIGRTKPMPPINVKANSKM